MKKRSEKLSLAVAAALSAYGVGSAYGVVSYSDNFNRATVNGTYTYTQTNVTSDGGASIIGTDILQLTNDASAAANTNGYVYLTTPTSAYTSFNNQLSGNGAGNALTWTLNMQQIRANPAGFGLGNYGAAIVLGATSSTLTGGGAANGYAIIMGNSGTPDPVRLVRFTGGLNSATTTIVSRAGEDVGVNFWSIKVSYDVNSGAWTLYTRNDGASTFADPTTGTYGVAAGSAVDTTYTSTALTHSGVLWSHSTGGSQLAKFDNFTLDIGAPPPPPVTPTNLTWDGDSGTGGVQGVSGTWEAANNWHNGVGNQTWSSAAPDNATFSTGSGTVTVATAQVVGSITINAGTNYTISGAGGLTVNGVSGVGILANESATINTKVGIGAPQSWTVAASKTLTIGDGTNGGLDLSGSITKEGTGTLLLNTPASTRTGQTIINAGTVVINSVDANKISGLGTGATTINSGATLRIDNINWGQSAGSPPPPIDTRPAVAMNNGSTIIGTGTAQINGNPLSVNRTTGVVVDIKTLNASDVLTINSAIRNSASGTSGAKIVVSGPGRVLLASGATSDTSGGDQFSGSWELQSGDLKLGPQLVGGFGETLNALGYSPYVIGGNSVGDGRMGPGRPILVNGGRLLFGSNFPNLAPTGPISTDTYRSPITLNGGKMGSAVTDVGFGTDAYLSGDITVTGNSEIFTTDPDTSTAKNLMLKTEPLQANSAVVNGNLNWGNATLTVTGAGKLQFERDSADGPGAMAVSVTPGATLQINSGATVELGGTQDALSDGVDHVDVVNNSTTSLKVKENTKNVGGVSGVGNTTVDLGATMIAKHVRQNNLTVNGTAQARASLTPYNNGANASVSKVTSLTIGSGAKVDLTNTKIITQDASMVSTPVYDGINDIYIYDGVHGLVQKGRGDGTWNGTEGITTSQTEATTGILTSIAVGTGAELRGLGPTDTELFGGQTINGNSTIAMYTYTGDADMDGDLDGDDYFYLDSNVLASETIFGWHQGDFNYDGRLNGDDYFFLDSNTLQAQASGNIFYVRDPEFAAGSGGMTAVPEPASIGLLGMAAAGLLGRRRRSC